MIPNSCLSVMPFYNSLDEQSCNKDYATGAAFVLATPSGFLLPFQFMRTHSDHPLTSISLMSASTGLAVQDITSAMYNSGLTVTEYGDYGVDVVKYPGILPLAGVNVPPGSYFVKISAPGYETYYSEVFTYVPNTSNYLKVEFWDENPLTFDGGVIEYTNNFRHIVYLDTQLARPEYPLTQIVSDRDGRQFFEKQIAGKTYRAKFRAPEFLCDVLALIAQTSDYKSVTNRGTTYTPESFTFDFDWLDGGYYADVEIEMPSQTIVKKNCSVLPFVGVGRDFTDDFNDDFGPAGG